MGQRRVALFSQGKTCDQWVFGLKPPVWEGSPGVELPHWTGPAPCVVFSPVLFCMLTFP